MENKSHALAAGTFVMVLLALLVAMAVWLTRDTRDLHVYEISSSEPVTGLQQQASVRFKGVNVGKVTDIGFDPTASGQVRIRISVDEQAPITESTFATLGFQGVTGLAFVQLDDSGQSKVVLVGNKERPPRIPMRPGLLAKLSAQGEIILTELAETTRRVNLLLQPDNQQGLLKAVASFGQAAGSVQQLSVDANKALPQLLQDVTVTLKSLQDTSVRVGESADEARTSARAFRVVTERMDAPGGALDQLAGGVDSLTSTAQAVSATTLPRLNHAVDDTARMARQLGRLAGAVSEHPQSLIFGNAPLPPGPGEPGFSVTLGQP